MSVRTGTGHKIQHNRRFFVQENVSIGSQSLIKERLYLYLLYQRENVWTVSQIAIFLVWHEIIAWLYFFRFCNTVYSFDIYFFVCPLSQFAVFRSFWNYSFITFSQSQVLCTWVLTDLKFFDQKAKPSLQKRMLIEGGDNGQWGLFSAKTSKRRRRYRNDIFIKFLFVKLHKTYKCLV